jgi:RHS repeat-associated protein
MALTRNRYQRNSSWNAPYTFSGKEKDVETGYGYFGARYYDSGLSIWLSVDPMSDKYPSMSPYNYCGNNPIILVDPDGRDIDTDILNSKTGECKHINDGKNQIVILNNDNFSEIAKMNKSEYKSMSPNEQSRYNEILKNGQVVDLSSQLGKTIRAVYAEMGNVESTQEDRNIVAASIATRLKSGLSIDEILVKKQYNAVSKDEYKNGPYWREQQVAKTSPHFYKKYFTQFNTMRTGSISAAYKALNGLLPPVYDNVHSFVSLPKKPNHFDSNSNLINVNSSFSNRKGVVGVWKLKK